MIKLTSLISDGVQRRWGSLVFASIALSPLTSFAQQYQETALIANTSQPGVTKVDPSLVNPWGIARSSAGPWWVSDQGKGVSTIYNGSGQPAAPVLVTIPSAGQGGDWQPHRHCVQWEFRLST
jgi:hypothetical protein